MSDRTW